MSTGPSIPITPAPDLVVEASGLTWHSAVEVWTSLDGRQHFWHYRYHHVQFGGGTPDNVEEPHPRSDEFWEYFQTYSGRRLRTPLLPKRPYGGYLAPLQVKDGDVVGALAALARKKPGRWRESWWERIDELSEADPDSYIAEDGIRLEGSQCLTRGELALLELCWFDVHPSIRIDLLLMMSARERHALWDDLRTWGHEDLLDLAQRLPRRHVLTQRGWAQVRREVPGDISLQWIRRALAWLDAPAERVVRCRSRCEP
jgi:hypothetical protein